MLTRITIPPGTYILDPADALRAEFLMNQPVGTDEGVDWGLREAFLWNQHAAHYFLFDNVFDEVAAGPRMAGLPEGGVQQLVSEALCTVGLECLNSKAEFTSPWDLSGGQQQRLLVSLLLTRQIRNIVAVDPLAHVDRDSRAHLYRLVSSYIGTRGGYLVFLRSIPGLPTDIPSGSISLLGAITAPLPQDLARSLIDSQRPSSATIRTLNAGRQTSEVLRMSGDQR